MPTEEILEGEIYEIIYHNEDNGYTVCEVTYNKSITTVCGIMPFIAPGISVRVHGKWIEHPDYGEQFQADFVERALPTKVSSIITYLSSGIVEGVREATARKIVREFGEDSLRVIACECEKLSSIKGISLARAKRISESYLSREDAARTIIFLQEYGVSASLGMRVFKIFGQASCEIIKENPYVLCEKVDRIGFKTADRIAFEMNISRNHPARIASGLRYILFDASLNGHTCMEHNCLIKTGVSFLGCIIEDVINAYEGLKSTGGIIFENGFDFLPTYYNAELLCAQRLFELNRAPQKASKFIDFDIKSFSESHGIELSPLQEKAVKMANENGVLVITGGPGTGKTTIMRIILEIFKAHKLKVSLCAPTGKAAKRLSESCMTEAKTLHRLLEAEGHGVQGDEASVFARNEQNPIDADVCIIDEMSMVDTLIFASLLRALKKGTRLIMAGDSDQLPSVGAGNVLSDILESGKIPSVRLNEVFRQAEESKIVMNAHKINNGIMPVANEKGSDFFFMPRNGKTALITIGDLVKSRLPKAYSYDSLSDIQILSPSRKGILGTQNLNIELQKILNPPSKSKKEKAFGTRIFRQGDKVIQIKNNYDIIWTEKGSTKEGFGIYNGDIGIIEDIDFTEKILIILFDDSHLVEYDFNMIEDLEIAYALTVHKSQGSEWNAVIIPVASFPPMLMTRNLLYTAVTRARKLAVLVGSEEAVLRMVSNDKKQKRYSMLKERIEALFL